MSTAPEGYQTPKTDWAAEDALTTTAFNRIEDNINSIETGSRTVDQGQAPSGPAGSLRQFLDWFANRLKAITGEANWWTAPAATIAAIWAKFHGATGHAHTGGDGDGPPLPYGAVSPDLSDITRHSRTGERDDDPVTFVNVSGRGLLLRADMWARSSSATLEINVDSQGWVSIPGISWRAGVGGANSYSTYSFTVPPVFFSASLQIRVKFWTIHTDDRCAAVAWTRLFGGGGAS